MTGASSDQIARGSFAGCQTDEPLQRASMLFGTHTKPSGVGYAEAHFKYGHCCKKFALQSVFFALRHVQQHSLALRVHLPLYRAPSNVSGNQSPDRPQDAANKAEPVFELDGSPSDNKRHPDSHEYGHYDGEDDKAGRTKSLVMSNHSGRMPRRLAAVESST